MKRATTVHSLVAIVFAATSNATALSATINISPVELNLKPREKATSFTVSNDSEEVVDIEANSATWSQSMTGESKVPGDFLVISPSIFRMQPHAHQIVRVAEKVQGSLVRERAYRVVLSQIAKAGELGVQMLLRFDLPLFVNAQTSASAMHWRVSADHTGTVLIGENSGSAHVTFSSVIVESGANKISVESGRRTVLAGGIAHWSLPSSFKGNATVTVLAKSQLGSTEVVISPTSSL